MDIDYTYFEDEVRDGFYVPAMMKRAWAAQLEVLHELDRICNKYDITYYAAWGTMLGAVRHGGFVPWDDDMDIYMKRKDYNKLLKVVEKEIPDGWSFVTFYNQEDYWEFCARLVSTKYISVEKEYLKHFHGFPFMAGIDIFVLDYLAPTEEENELTYNKLAFVMLVQSEIEKGNFSDEQIESYLQDIEQLCNVKINRNEPLKLQLYTVMEKIYMEYDDKEGEWLTSMYLWLETNKNFKYPAQWFDETIRVPFETITVPIVLKYDLALRKCYDDYMNPVQSGGSHDYPYYKRYYDYLKLNDTSLLHFEITEDDLKREYGEASPAISLKKQSREVTKMLDYINEQISGQIIQNNWKAALQLLEAGQKTSIEYGTLVEQIKGEGTSVVHGLERYCELIFDAYTYISDSVDNAENVTFYDELDVRLKSLEECVKDIKSYVEKDILNKNIIVFLPYKASAWNSFKNIWEAACQDENCEVYVMPIPYYDKKLDGSLNELHYEGDKFPKEVKIVQYDMFDLKKCYPDIIFIHNPYDEYNYTTSIHPYFYSKKLQKFTDKLVYIPYFELNDFTEEQERAVEHMSSYCIMPGVVHSDVVIVQSENMRRLYIEKLTTAAGEDTRSIWENKVVCMKLPADRRNEETEYEDIPECFSNLAERRKANGKSVIYYISVGNIVEYAQTALKKIESVLETFEMHKDEVTLIWRHDALIREVLENGYHDLYEGYMNILDKCRQKPWIVSDFDNNIDEYINLSDAYYGDGSPLANKCRNYGKPVMLQSIDDVE